MRYGVYFRVRVGVYGKHRNKVPVPLSDRGVL